MRTTITRFLGLFVLPLIAAAQLDFNLNLQFMQVPGSPSRVLYAVAGTTPGLFKSTDGGANWTALYITQAGLPQPSIGGIVIDPRNEQVLYLSTTQAMGSVWKSTDGGTTWVRAGSGLPQGAGTATHLTLVRSQPQNLYVRIGDALYKSVNGAQTWAKQSTLPGAFSVFIIHPANPARMYYFEAAGAGYRSSDEGLTWTRGASINLFGDSFTKVTSAAVDSSDLNRVYVGVAGSLIRFGDTIVAGIHLSTDGLETIRPLRGSETINLLTDPTGRPIVYELGSAGGLSKSPDRGQTWIPLRVTTAPVEFIRSLLIDPNNPDILYTGILYRSDNAGSSFTKIEAKVRPTLAQPQIPVEFRLAEGETGSLILPISVLESNTLQVPVTTAVQGASWLTAGAASGNTPFNLTLSANTAGLPPGIHMGTLRVSSTQTANSALDIPVKLVIGPGVSSGAQYMISTVAGNGTFGLGADGPALATPVVASALALDRAGNLFVAASSSQIVYRIDRMENLKRFAGTGSFGFSGDGGPAAAAQLSSPSGVAVDGEDRVFIADRSNNRVRMVAGGTISTAASSASAGSFFFSSPRGLTVRPDGRVAITVSSGIALLTPPSSVSSAFITQPRFSAAAGIAADAERNYYVADSGAHQIFKIDPMGNARPVAGNGARGFTGDGPQATEVALNAPEGVALDRDGNLFIADTGNNRIRVLTPDGAIRTIAGSGASGFAGDNGPAAQARLSGPTGVAIDSEGSVYVADGINRRVRKLSRLVAPVPQISNNSFVNAADGSPRLAAGGLFSQFGSDLSTAEQTATSAPWPILLGGATIFVRDRAAPLYFNNGRQINGQIPFELQPGPATVRVEVAGSRSREIAVTILPAAPGILQFGERRAVAVNPNGSVNTQENPIAPGAVLLVYLSGIGAVDNPVPSGAAASADPLSRPVLPVKAAIGDETVVIQFIGLAPGFVGLAQANLVVPRLPPGDYELVITVNGADSNRVLVTIGN